MKQKKFNGKVIVMLMLILISTFLLYKHFNNDNELDSEVDTYTSNSGTFLIMLQQEDGSYEASETSTWPSYSDYVYNEDATTCVDNDGNTVSVEISFSNSSSGSTITLKGSTQAYCKLYFDLKVDAGYCLNNGITNLEECILRSENESSSLSVAKTYIKSKGTPDFSTTATTDEGLYYAADDYGDSFYFRGAVTDNYVSYAGYTWRIIRINGDGSIRIILDGYIDDSDVSFNSYNDYNAYVGYMYGTASASSYTTEHANTNSSTIKLTLDSWYETNLLNKSDGTYSYAKYLSDTLFCNDRSVYSGNGYSRTGATYYAAYGRLIYNKSPILTCSSKSDRFTVSDTTYGNGALTYPIALITADEAALAGNVVAVENQDTYLYVFTTTFFTMTPSHFVIDDYSASTFTLTSTVGIGNASVTNTYSIRPVVNLSSSVIITKGTGTVSNPYVVALSS